MCEVSLKPKTPKAAQVLLQKRDVRLNRLPSRLGTSCSTLSLSLPSPCPSSDVTQLAAVLMHLESLHGRKVPEIETETLVQLALIRYAAVHFGYGLRVRLGGTGSASVCRHAHPTWRYVLAIMIIIIVRCEAFGS